MPTKYKPNRFLADYFRFTPFPDQLRLKIMIRPGGLFQYEKGSFFQAKVEKVVFRPSGSVESITIAFNNKKLRLSASEWDNYVEAYANEASLIFSQGSGFSSKAREKELKAANSRMIRNLSAQVNARLKAEKAAGVITLEELEPTTEFEDEKK